VGRGKSSKTAGGQKPVRFAVIGMGHFAQAAILPGFRTARGCELAAIFSDDKTKLRTLARKYRVSAALDYTQYDEYLRGGNVDAVYIALPNSMHCDYAVRAAQAGVHVLTEKPMALDSREASRMIDACARNSVQLMTAYRLHFERCNLEVAEIVRRRKLGEPRFFDAQFSMQVKAGNIRTRADLADGPVWDIGIYCINAARMAFAAEPIEVWATAANSKDKRFAEITGAPVGATYKKYVEGIALGRAQTPEDVAAFVSFLAGPDSDYMTGQAPLIDGGLVYR
jgi:glucose-fructose oxidoreductase